MIYIYHYSDMYTLLCYWEGWKLFLTFHNLPIYSQISATNCCDKIPCKFLTIDLKIDKLDSFYTYKNRGHF